MSPNNFLSSEALKLISMARFGFSRHFYIPAPILQLSKKKLDWEEMTIYEGCIRVAV